MTMEVACPQCSAKYQFDAAAIPAQGYDAQCTGCGQVFFVAPEQPVDPQISVSCAHCAAVYQFPASAIPAEGYDAQCTQCQQVFFVSATQDASPAPVESAPDQPEAAAPSHPHVEPTPLESEAESAPLQPPVEPAVASPVIAPAPVALPQEPTPLTDLKSPPLEPVALESPKSAAADPAAPVEAAETPAADAPGPDAHDMMALSEELGEPEASPDGVSLEDDFGTIIKRRRTRRTVALVALVVVLLYSLITYRFAPRVFDITVGRVVPIKLTVHPDAIPHAERAVARMLDDTAVAYKEALVELDAALAIDDRYPEAIAYKGLALVFSGSDVQANGRAVRQRGEDALAEMRALEGLAGKLRPKDADARIAELRKRATAAGHDSAQLFEAGGKTVREGFALLRDGLGAYEDVPLVVEAAGIYYTTDSDSLPRAGVLLRHSLALRFGPDVELNLEDPPNGWLPYLQGLVQASERSEKSRASARAAFAAAIEKEPRLQRARYSLALFDEKQGKRAEAERLAKEILAAVPEHGKAKELLGRGKPVAASVQGAKPPPTPPKGKKRKRKRR